MFFWKQYNTFIAIFLLLLIPVLTLSSDANAQGMLGGLSSFSQSIAATATGGALSWVGDLFDSSSSIEIEEMKQEIDALREENTRLIGVLQENSRLRKLVGFRTNNPTFSLVPAEVIARDVSPFFNVVSIKIKSDADIKPNQAVVSHEGIVGKIESVNGTYAKVRLISDHRSGIDVLTQRTRARAVVRGKGSPNNVSIKIQYLDSDSEIRKGDLVVTSGMGGVFPPNLIVGHLDRIEAKSNTMFRKAELVPAVDFGRLQSVYVIGARDPKKKAKKENIR